VADLPLPTFATLEKLYDWAAEQATILVRVIEDPARYYIKSVRRLAEPLPQSLKFFAFVILVCSIVTVPIDTILWKINIFDFGVFVSGTILNVMTVVVFGISTHWIARMLGGRGEFRRTLAAMLYSSAFLPILMTTHFFTRLDPAFRAAILNRDFSNIWLFSSPAIFIGSLLEIIVLVWVIVKLVPLIRVVHSLPRFKALSTIVLAGVIENFYEWSVALPFFAEIVKAANKSG
jgi:hypothetical protein